MTRAEATKQANSIIDYFVKITEFERRCDIDLVISEDEMPEDTAAAKTWQNTTYKKFTVKAYVDQCTKPAELARNICHELAHVFTGEMRQFYHTFVGEPDDDETAISWQVWLEKHERITMRLGVILFELWKKHGGKTK